MTLFETQCTDDLLYSLLLMVAYVDDDEDKIDGSTPGLTGITVSSVYRSLADELKIKRKQD